MAGILGAVAWAGNASAATGTLELCKSPANGANGVSFKFTATNLASGNVKSVSVKGGSCSTAMNAGTGKWAVQEDLSSGIWSVSSIAVLPSTDVVNGTADLTDGLIAVKVAAGIETQVTFTNAQATATIKVCKWSATPAIQGATFTFNIAGTTVSAVAGDSAADAGCSSPVAVQPGSKITVSESVPANEQVAGIMAGGNLKLTSSTGGIASVTVGSGANIVTYDNEPVGPPQTGYIEVCKGAYDGYVSGSYAFTITDTAGLKDTETVPVGQCTGPIKVAAGDVNVVETATPGSYVQSISTIPSTALGPYNLTNGTATVVVPVSSSTNAEAQVTFVNATQLGLLKVCKVLTATSGALAGQTFSFQVVSAAGNEGISIVASSSPNGACVNYDLLPVGSQVTVSEQGRPFVAVVGSSAGVGNGGSQTITVQPGINVVSFTNQAYGTIEVCKVMAATDQAYNGTAFNFSVNGGASFPLRAGLGCSGPMTVPAGTATVSEAPLKGFAFVSATATDPTGATNRIVTAGNPLTVSIPYPGGGGNETLVTFTNQVLKSNFKICKLIDPGSLTLLGGLNFTFNWQATVNGVTATGTATVTPPYNGPGGSCTSLQLAGFPVINPNGTPTTITITEVPGFNYVVIGIGVDNAALDPNVIPNPDLFFGSVTINPGTGIATVTFTNAFGQNQGCGHSQRLLAQQLC